MLEQHADYDGLAVLWGIGHTTQSVEDCAEACRSYIPALQQGGELALPDERCMLLLHCCSVVSVHAIHQALSQMHPV